MLEVFRGRARRVAVVDFDVHHGNGTQAWAEAAASDRLLFASVHCHETFEDSDLDFFPGGTAGAAFFAAPAGATAAAEAEAKAASASAASTGGSAAGGGAAGTTGPFHSNTAVGETRMVLQAILHFAASVTLFCPTIQKRVTKS